jgi:L-lactate dehydrogenase complex protein LldG
MAARTQVIDAFAERLRANACVVHGPVAREAARDIVIERAHAFGSTAALNADTPIDGLGDALTLADARHADVGITGSCIAVAEPAAIGLAAAPGSPRATSLVPPAHIVVVPVDRLVPTLADAFARVSAEPLPSALTWIGGPSRTGDLEMILTLGVHGPRVVEVVLLAADG